MQYVQFYLRNGLLGTKRTGVIVTLFEKQTPFLKTYPKFEKAPLAGKKFENDPCVLVYFRRRAIKHPLVVDPPLDLPR